MKLWYSVNDDDSEYRFCVKYTPSASSIKDDLDKEMAANHCAEDFHSNHDGWEAVWPLDITLYESEDGPSIAKFEVDREAEPVFYVRRKVK